MCSLLHNSKGQALIGMAIALTVVVGTLLTVDQVRSVQNARSLVRNLDSEEGYYASEMALAYAYSAIQSGNPDASVGSTAISAENDSSALRNLQRMGGGISYRYVKGANSGPDQYCGTISLPQSTDRELCVEASAPALPTALTLTANGVSTAYTKSSAQTVTIAWSATTVTRCIDPFGGSELSGSVAIPDAQLQSKTVYSLECMSPTGPVSAVLTVSVPGKWYQANQQDCPTFCSAQAMENSPAPDGPSCGSGEVRVPSMTAAGITYPYGAWGSGLPLGWNGLSYGNRCYTNGQSHDGDSSDFTVACFCKSNKVLLGNPAVLSVTANGNDSSYIKQGAETVTIAWSASGGVSACTDPFGGTAMSGSIDIPHVELRSTKTFKLSCTTILGEVTQKVTVTVQGKWYQADKQGCQSFCAEAGLENVLSQDGSPCASGEVRMFSALRKGIQFTYGQGGSFTPNRNRPPVSMGENCFRDANWNQTPYPLTYTVGCFCK